MYEKYDAFVVGKGGGGGEYVPQVGFGWSNAVALLLINEDYPRVTDGGKSMRNSMEVIVAFAVTATVCAGLLVALGSFWLSRRSSSKPNSKANEELKMLPLEENSA